jgi:uncharacterized heparinase superfamily protein
MRGLAAMLCYWHTLRHLRPGQLIGRARFKLARPSPDLRPAPPLRGTGGHWTCPAARRPSMLGPSEFLFLNDRRSIDGGRWDDPTLAKLWRYNLHYFDDLCATGAPDRARWHHALIGRWVRENPPAHGTGWEPYPTSLRIVNWCKWTLAGNDLPAEAIHSLAVQARWLTRRLEWHLLGNHLFVNAKALVFAGCLFDGPEADAWRATGTRILVEQVPEQVLPDGGQFERSPMYHALALEDVLDLINLARTFPALGSGWMHAIEGCVGPMRRWLSVMCHPDGEVSFFNDSAIGVHPSPGELDRYARRLGLGELAAVADGVTVLADSGYVRMQRGDAVAIVDVGPVGPDYLPGHAHADTLSFELSIGGRRVLVNSGTSEYGVGPERLRQRGTAAHNTVVVNGQDSSEVWGGFRVARRARPSRLEVCPDSDPMRVACAHDGYARLRGSPSHRRTWELGTRSLRIIDDVSRARDARSRWHWAPGSEILDGDRVRLTCGRQLRLEAEGGEVTTMASTWHPEFGRVVSNALSEAKFVGARCTVTISWT